jgi:two-component system LytT family sensor kinase
LTVNALWRHARIWILLLGLWTIPGLVAAVIHYIRSLQYDWASWGVSLRLQILFWYLWIPITPIALWLGRRFSPFESGRRVRNIALHVLFAAVVSLIHLSLGLVVFRELSPEPPQLPYQQALLFFLASYFEFDMLIYAGIVVGGQALDYYRRSRRDAVRAAQLEAQLAEARLESLRSQLHPHFLFNTLHSISALMTKDVPAARRMMTRLSDLLRFALDETNGEEVPLGEELDFLERYVEIQKARFPERLEVEFDIEPASESMLVPRFVLQPLVENAIRHGADTRPDGRVVVRSRVLDGRLRLEIEDNGPGFPVDAPASPEGVGLRSTRARIDHLYREAGTIELTSPRNGHGALVRIEFPARAESAASS